MHGKLLSRIFTIAAYFKVDARAAFEKLGVLEKWKSN